MSRELTVIIGPNASGKSALLRAFRTLVLNSGHSKSYIRKGDSKAIVAFKADDGPVIAWERSKAGVVYTVGNQQFSKVGRSRLSDFIPDSGLIVDDQGSILQLHDEWSVLFPFGLSPASTFKLFEKLLKIAESAVIMDTIRKDSQQITNTRNELEEKKDHLEQSTATIEEVLSDVDFALIEKSKTQVAHWDKYLQELEVDFKAAERLTQEIMAIDEMLFLWKQIDVSKMDEFLGIYVDVRIAESLHKYVSVDTTLQVIPFELDDFYSMGKDYALSCVLIKEESRLTDMISKTYENKFLAEGELVKNSCLSFMWGGL